METITVTESSASPFVDAVCAEVEILGVVSTPFGDKPQVKFMFESNMINQYGEQRRFIRIFNKYFNDKSALSIAAKAWCGRDLADKMECFGEVDLQSFVGDQAQLKLEQITTKSGKPFDKIVEILPPSKVYVEPTWAKEEED